MQVVVQNSQFTLQIQFVEKDRHSRWRWKLKRYQLCYLNTQTNYFVCKMRIQSYQAISIYIIFLISNPFFESEFLVTQLLRVQQTSFVYQILFHFWTMKKTQLWTEADSKLFLELSKKYHNDFHQIAEEMHRTYSQVRSHHYNLQRKPSKSESEKPNNIKKQKAQKQSEKEKEQFSYIIFDDID
ncbi:SANT/Myb_domain [Hexamita inflata]|uniref:SANT/Myb_domain n=1 Tax=Hexamita inflata TaxID=28002 RepID=A0ABP1GWY3_9EUKA